MTTISLRGQLWFNSKLQSGNNPDWTNKSKKKRFIKGDMKVCEMGKPQPRIEFH